MRRFVLGFLVFAGTLAAAHRVGADVEKPVPAEAVNEPDLEKFQGAWILKELESQSRTIPVPEGGGSFIFSKDRKLVMKEKGKKDKDGSFSLDAGKAPKELDLTFTIGKEKKVVRTIYQLDGDTLKFACAIDGRKMDKRPASFDLKNAEIMIVILKRQKS